MKTLNAEATKTEKIKFRPFQSVVILRDEPKSQGFILSNILKLVIILGIAVPVFLFVYSASNYVILTESNTDKLTGEWYGMGYTYTFAPDGTFIGKWVEDSDSEDVCSFESNGSYTIAGDTLTLYNSVLQIDLFPIVSDSAKFIRKWVDEETNSVVWKYRIDFSEDMLYMNGINVYDSPRLAQTDN